MPFLRAGFNGRNRSTGIFGWTRNIAGGKFRLAELIVFTPAGDYAWIDAAFKPRFLAWGEACVLGSYGIDLPDEWQSGLQQSPLTLRERRARPVKLILPYPVSANRYWTSFWAKNLKRVITGVTKEAEAFKEECGWRAKAAGVRTPFRDPVELRIRLVPENRVCMDLDNALKVSIDALKGIVYEDDSQVYKITAERAEPEPGKRLEVEILPFTIPLALEAAA